MKNYFASIPNRMKAIYLVWIFIQLILLLSGNSYGWQNKSYFYPFEYGKLSIEGIGVYDYSEFIFYCIAPLLIYFVIKLWNKKDV